MKWTYFITRWPSNKAEWIGPFNTHKEAQDWNSSQKHWNQGFIQAIRGEAAIRFILDTEILKP